MILLDRRRVPIIGDEDPFIAQLKAMGCIMYFPFDSNNGLKDIIGHRTLNNLVTNKGAVWNSTYGCYACMHGTAAQAVADINVNFDSNTFPQGEWTTVTQIRRHPTSSSRGTSHAFTITSSKNKVFFMGLNEAGTAATQNWTEDSWHTTTAVCSTSDRRLFHNKALLVSDSTTYTLPWPISKIYMAAYNSAYANKACFIRNYLLFNRKLTDTEVMWLYNQLPLPYDAEVEYIQSNGSQNIVLPMSIAAGDFFEIVLEWENNTTSTSKQLWVSNTSNEFLARTYSYSSPNMVFASWIGKVSTNGGFAVSDNTKVTTLVSTTHVNSSSVSRPIKNAFTQLTLLGTGSARLSAKIYSCKITCNSTLIYDLIPVRVGTQGYLYDKISGRVSGTGSFAVGSDK